MNREMSLGEGRESQIKDRVARCFGHPRVRTKYQRAVQYYLLAIRSNRYVVLVAEYFVICCTALVLRTSLVFISTGTCYCSWLARATRE